MLWSWRPSLYGGLPERQIGILEKALKHRVYGLYSEAEVLFLECLQLGWSPVILLEHAMMYDQMGLEHEKQAKLREILQRISLDADQYSLTDFCKLHLIQSQWMTNGKLRAGLAHLKQVAERLYDVDVSQYTEMMFATLCHYYNVLYVYKSSSNWINWSDTSLPSLSALRKHLLGQDKLIEAQLVVRLESHLAMGADILLPFEDWLDRAEKHSGQSSEVLIAHRCIFRTLYAGRLNELDRKQEARHELSQARGLLRRLSEFLPAVRHPRLELLVEAREYEISPLGEPLALANQYLAFASSAQASRDLLTQRQFLRKALDTVCDAVTYSTQTRMEVFHRQSELLTGYLDFEISHSRCAFLIAKCLCTAFGIMDVTESLSEWLVYFKDFEDKYVEFDVPGTGEALYRSAKLAAKIAGDDGLSAKYEERRMQFRSQCASIEMNIDGQETYAGGEPSNYSQEWNDALFGGENVLESLKSLSAKLILRWAKRDLIEKDLLESDAKVILCTKYIVNEGQEDIGNLLEWASRLDIKALQDAIHGLSVPTGADRWDAWFSVTEAWLRRDLGPSILHRHYLLKKLSQIRSLCWLAGRPSPMPKDTIIRSEQEFRRELQIHQSVRSEVVTQDEILYCKTRIANHLVNIGYSPIARTENLINDEKLDLARTMLEENAEVFRNRDLVQSLYWHLRLLGSCSWIRFFYYGTVPPWKCLEYIDEADQVFRRILKSRSILDARRAFLTKHTLTQEVLHSETLDLGMKGALAGYLQMIDAHPDKKGGVSGEQSAVESEHLTIDFIKWTQKAKARSLTDVIGLGERLPASSLFEAQQHASCRQLLDGEVSLVNQLEAANIAQKIRIQKELEDLYRQMRAEPLLATVLEIYDGASVPASELQAMCAHFDEEICFADWAYIKGRDDWDLVLCLYRNGRLDSVNRLPLKLEHVQAWIRQYLDPPEPIDEEDDANFCPLNDRSARKALQYLTPLIAPTEQLTRPGELIIFCPTQALYRVPLHAIYLDGQPIIARNPIVYCQSLTLLRLCLRNRMQISPDKTGVFHPTVFSPLSNEPRTKLLVDAIAATLGTTVQPPPTPSEDTTPKQAFLTTASTSNFIHFHGHVRFSASSPLSHHLELVPAPILDPDAQTLSAGSIFDALRLPPGSHVTTISCKSARALISSANELLGLVAALHYAGASSVVCSLWNIHREDGAAFAATLYEHVMAQMRTPLTVGAQTGSDVVTGQAVAGKGDGNGKADGADLGVSDARGEQGSWVDLARAAQAATMAAMRDAKGQMRAPYHWAGLVLKGAWILGRDPALAQAL